MAWHRLPALAILGHIALGWTMADMPFSPTRLKF